MINELRNRLRILLDRATLSRVTYRGLLRVLQIVPRRGAALDGIEHLEPFGFTSHAPTGAEALTANLGGDRNRAVVIVLADRRHRIVIGEGESAIYNAAGDKVHVKADGTIGMVASTQVEIISPRTVLSGDLDVGGNITCDGSVESLGDQVAGGLSQLDHKHGGVTTGTGTSGTPVP